MNFFQEKGNFTRRVLRVKIKGGLDSILQPVLTTMLINIHFRNQWNESMGYPPCDISPIKTPTPIFQEEEEREKSKASIRVARFEKRSTINGQATCRSTVVHCGLMSRVDIVAATLQRGARRSRDREAQNRRFHSPRQQ